MKEKLKKISKGEKTLIGAVVVFLFFFVAVIMATQIEVTFSANVGWATARTFPYLFCGLGVVLSIAYIWQAVKLIKQERQTAETPEENEIVTETKKNWSVLASIVLCLVFVLTVKWLGVVLGGMLYLFAQILILLPEEKRTKKYYLIAVAISVLLPVAIYIPFRYVFETVLPLGILKGLF